MTDDLKEYVHFCCTSEDINNLAYSLMLTEAKNKVLVKTIDELIQKMATMAETVFTIFFKKICLF